MFDLQAALADLDGTCCNFDQLEQLLGDIRRKHLGEMSPEIGVRELLGFAKQWQLIREDDDGQCHIDARKAA